jgi:putative transposase
MGEVHFPSDEAATKLIWLVLQKAQEKWVRPSVTWDVAKTQFAIHFKDKLAVTS